MANITVFTIRWASYIYLFEKRKRPGFWTNSFSSFWYSLPKTSETELIFTWIDPLENSRMAVSSIKPS